MSAEDWAQGEIVRTLQGVSAQVTEIDRKLDGLSDKFVSREVFDLRMNALTAAETKLETIANDFISKKAAYAILTLIAALAVGAGTMIGALHP